MTPAMINSDEELKKLKERLVSLQLKYDAEHMKVLDLEARLHTEQTRQQALVGNPLAKQVKALQKTVADQDKIISNCNAEINRLRDLLQSKG